MDFLKFRNQMQVHVDSMLKDIDHLFVVDVGDKNDFNNKYLASFPVGTNEIFRERREYDCSACRHFIKDFGMVDIGKIADYIQDTYIQGIDNKVVILNWKKYS
jgi:hypothetical protein